VESSYCHFCLRIASNGPAVGLSKRYPTHAPGRVLVPRPEYSGGPQNCHGARRVWRTFCRHGTNFIEHYACRGTKLIGAGKLSRFIEVLLRADARFARRSFAESGVRVQVSAGFVLGAGFCKNHDESINYTVHVSG